MRKLLLIIAANAIASLIAVFMVLQWGHTPWPVLGFVLFVGTAFASMAYAIKEFM